MPTKHILIVTTHPDFPDQYNTTTECHDPERTRCNYWSLCATCATNNRTPTDDELDDGEATIHGETHLIFEGDFCTLTPDCITDHDDGNATDDAAHETGPGRWYVDVEWDEGLVVNPGHPEPAE